MSNPRKDWELVAVDDVCDLIIDCINKTAPTIDSPTPFKMIRTSNVRDGWVDTSNVKYVDSAVYKKWTRRGTPSYGDVILTREAPLGQVGLLRSKDEVFLGQRLVMYRADPEKLDNRFLLYSLMGHDLQGQIKALGSGATVEHMRVPDCKKLVLRIPTLPTQCKIASVLSTYDELTDNNLRRIKILEEMAQTLYREWFVKFRFPGHKKVRMVESPLGKIPNGWEVKQIEAMCEFISRGVTPKYQGGSGRYIINQRANRGASLSLSDLKELRLDLKVPEEKLAHREDLLVNSLGEGTLGRVHFFNGPHREWAVDQHMTICRSSLQGVTHYLYMALSSPSGQAKIQSVKTGATNMTMLNISTLRRFEYPFPGRDLLRNYYNYVKPLMEHKRILEEKNVNLRLTRDLLLPNLISGELDVSELDIDIDEEAA